MFCSLTVLGTWELRIYLHVAVNQKVVNISNSMRYKCQRKVQGTNLLTRRQMLLLLLFLFCRKDLVLKANFFCFGHEII